MHFHCNTSKPSIKSYLDIYQTRPKNVIQLFAADHIDYK